MPIIMTAHMTKTNAKRRKRADRDEHVNSLCHKFRNQFRHLCTFALTVALFESDISRRTARRLPISCK